MRHPSLIPLSHDHHHGLALALRCRKQALGHIKPMGTAGLHERATEVLAFYDSNLIAHFRAEEEVLFPALRAAAPQTGPMIEQLLKDHERIRESMIQLKGGAGLAKLLFDLGDLLEHHIRREERELFPLFEQQVNASEAESIGEKLEKILTAKSKN
jgi:iron-sulfur cluster repair protein YtfE (RIC family)